MAEVIGYASLESNEPPGTVELDTRYIPIQCLRYVGGCERRENIIVSFPAQKIIDILDQRFHPQENMSRIWLAYIQDPTRTKAEISRMLAIAQTTIQAFLDQSSYKGRRLWDQGYVGGIIDENDFSSITGYQPSGRLQKERLQFLSNL
jgi:hypothetical protein